MSDSESLQEKIAGFLKTRPKQDKQLSHEKVKRTGAAKEKVLPSEKALPYDIYPKSFLQRIQEQYPLRSTHWGKIELLNLRQVLLLQYNIEPSHNNPYYSQETFFLFVERGDELHIWELMSAGIQTGNLKLFSPDQIRREDFCRWLIDQGVTPAAVFALKVVPISSFDSQNSHKQESKQSCSSPLRAEQEDKIRCQVIAQILWDQSPKMTITDICKDDWIKKFGNGNQYKGKHTIRNWVKEVDRRPAEEKSGRPPKKPKI